MMGSTDRLADFLALSASLTGYSVFRLRGTGQAERYLGAVVDIVGEGTVDELLAAYRGVATEAADDEAALASGMRRAIMSDDKLGPLARNVVKLWYLGSWQELPAHWREAYGSSEKDRPFVVSPESYTEGLLWPSVGANPPGAKPFGYGMWATTPRIETT